MVLVVDAPVLIVGEGRLPPFSPLNARDERGCGELDEIQVERLLNLGPDPLNRVSIESENRAEPHDQHECTLRLVHYDIAKMNMNMLHLSENRGQLA